MSTNAPKYHLSRNGTVGLCEASIKPCPLGGVHYSTKEEAQYDLMDLNVIRNHWLTGGGVGEGWSCTCGWEPGDRTFSGRDKVKAHAHVAHSIEVDEAKAAWEDVKREQLANELLAAGEPFDTDLPHASASEAWSEIFARPTFKNNLELAAMAGYRSYDASTIEESTDLAHSELINKYALLPGALGARDVEVLLAHKDKVNARLRPLVKQLYLVGHLGNEDADAEARMAERQRQVQEKLRLEREAGGTPRSRRS